MRRYWISSEYIEGSFIQIQGSEFHHIHDVCRQEIGSRFEVLVGDGKVFFVEVIECSKKNMKVKILETRLIKPLPKPHIYLALSVPKFPTFEAIIEKSVELGVKGIFPFVSEYSFLRKIEGPLKDKQKRWEKIILGATQQCGRGELLELTPAMTFKEVLEKFNHNDNAMGLFAYEGSGGVSLKKYLSSKSLEGTENIWLFIGSEGGFSVKEVEKFKTIGLQPVTLGDQILRVETACLALTSILKYELGLMS